MIIVGATRSLHSSRHSLRVIHSIRSASGRMEAEEKGVQEVIDIYCYVKSLVKVSFEERKVFGGEEGKR